MLLVVVLLMAGMGAAGCMAARKHPPDVLLAVLAGIPVFLGTVSLVLADVGLYHRGILAALSVLWASVGIWRLRSYRLNRKQGLWVFAVLGVGLAAAILFARPHRYLHGGWDPGEYVCTSSMIAHTGSIRYTEPFLPEIPDTLYPTFGRHPFASRPTLHAGYLILDRETGKMVPDYFHLYPAWLSLFQSTSCADAVYRGQTMVAVSALMVFFLYVQSMMGIKQGLVAAAVLLLNPATLYFARFPSTEMLSMLLLFSCLFFLRQREHSKSRGGLFVLAWVAYATTTAHIINLVPLLAMVLTTFAYGVIRKEADSRFDAIAMVAGIVVGTVRNAVVTPLFVNTLVRSYVIQRPGYVVGLSCVLALLVFTLWKVWQRLRPRLSDEGSCGRLWRCVPGILVLIFGIYHYFIRPRVESGHDVLNLQSMGWLFSPAGVLLVFAAFMLPLRKRLTRNEMLLLAAGGLTTVILLQQKHIQPFYMWAYRRYLPFVIPFFAILLTHTLFGLMERLRRVKLHALPYAILILILGWQGYMARGLIQAQEHRGLPRHVQRVAAALQDADFVLIDHWKLATPLRIAHGLPVYQLSTEPEPVVADRQAALYALLLDKLHAGQTVYYVTHSRPFYLPGYPSRRVADFMHRADTMRWHRQGIPVGTQTDDSSVSVYEFIEGQDATFAYVDFDVGYHSVGLLRGFYEMRRRPDRTMRWTNGDGALYIPGLSQGGWITLSLSHGRTDDFPAAIELGLYLDGEAWETLMIGQDWEDYTLALPPSMQAVQTLRLKSDTWDPALYGITGYPADLGVGISAIRISVEQPCDVRAADVAPPE